MDITLISRSFQTHKQGMGTYSKFLYEGFKNERDFNIKLISQDDSFFQRDSALDYLFYSLIEIPFKLKKIDSSDIYHALSPIESFYLNSNKTIVTVLDLIPIKMPGLIQTSFQDKLIKLFFDKALKKSSKAKEIVSISEETAKYLTNQYNVDYDDLHIVRLPIDNKFSPKRINNELFTVGTISHLQPRKRVDILIKSFLKADIKNSQLLIGGKGPEYEYLKKLAKNDFRIKFLGFVSDDEMNEFYNSLDVFVFPTIMEGYGLPIVEAMACEKPIITLKDGDIPSDVKNKTFISSKSNLSEDLKNQSFCCDLKSNKEFAKEHSPKKIGKKMIKIYKSMT